MANPAFVVQIKDLDRGPKQVQWTISEEWLRQAFAETDAEPRGTGELEVELTKSGRDVVVRGSAKAAVTMPCSRTLDPVHIALEPEIFLMLARTEPAEGGGGQRRAKKGGRRGSSVPAREEKPKRGWQDDPDLADEHAARDFFVGEQITLDPFVREFLLLELPMFPVRSDLPSDAPAAIAPPSPASTGAARAEGAEPQRIDPRLAPLAAIKSRLKKE